MQRENIGMKWRYVYQMRDRSRWKADEAKKCQPGTLSSHPGGKAKC